MNINLILIRIIVGLFCALMAILSVGPVVSAEEKTKQNSSAQDKGALRPTPATTDQTKNAKVSQEASDSESTSQSTSQSQAIPSHLYGEGSSADNTNDMTPY